MSGARPPTRVGSLIACALLAASGCTTGVELTVRVQSGLHAGHEIRFVEVSLYAGSLDCTEVRTPIQVWTRALSTRDQPELAEGTLTLAERGELPAGIYTVHVEARRPGAGSSPDSGPVLLERCVVTSLTNTRILRVPLTSNCVGVACPAPGGSPAFDQCINGGCVAPGCDPDDPMTVELCCDRALLGEACDGAPTLCRDADDCAAHAECAGPASCDRGVCVEPVEDLCPASEYCDAVEGRCLAVTAQGPEDAGVPDAPGADAPGADAGLPGLGEDCTTLGDEDGDTLADCADVECQPLTLCMLTGCEPVAPAPPPAESIPLPAHWYRGEPSVLTSSRGELCIVRDLVGRAHMNPTLPTGLGRDTVGGRAAISFGATSGIGATAYMPFVDPEGDHSVFVVSQALGDSPSVSVLDARPPAPGTGSSIALSQRGGTHLLMVEASVLELGVATTDEVVLEALSVGPLARGTPFLDAIEYRRNGRPIAPTLRSGTGLADPPDPPRGVALSTLLCTTLGGGGLRVAEILVYDRRSSAVERGTVETYLSDRYGIPIP